MNILLATTNWFPSGGDWTYIESICKIYESNGHKIIPFAMHDSRNYPTFFNDYFLENINYRDLNKSKTLKNSLKVLTRSIYSLDAKKKIRSLLDDYPVDIAQLNNIHNIHTLSIIKELKKSRVPIVWRVLDYKIICPNRTFLANGKICEDCFKSKFYNCFLKKCKKNSFSASLIATVESYFNMYMDFYSDIDKFLFQSEFSRDMFVRFGFDIGKTEVIENPYEFKNINSDFDFILNNKYILYFGRISKEKGIFTMYDAMKQIPDINLKVIGDGPDLESSIAYTTFNNISNIEFLGAKWGDELSPFIRNCQFVVVPSEWYEPNPYVVLQTFSFGKPVIASKIGGLKDMVTNNVNGLLTKPFDSFGLSQVIKDLFYDEDKARSLGKNALLTLESKHNPQYYYDRTIDLFDKLLN